MPRAYFANSDGPLANFDAFPAATDTYPGPPEPREPPPLFPIFATHHQLNTLRGTQMMSMSIPSLKWHVSSGSSWNCNDMILGFTWQHEHNPEIDWTKEEAHKKQRAKVHEHAAVHACHAGHFPYADLNLLIPPLEFPYREALYKDVQGVGCKSLEKEGGEGEWTSISDAESPDETAEQKSQPKAFYSTIPNHLHDFEDVFSKASFDSLQECKQWDHAIELILEPSSWKVYLLVPHEQDELDTFLQENLSSG
ncbi:hypothetical protein E4T56_gene11184 [Termitomyces sp. T112]|nr:hypothetical protein E4T56_gene11184 [Termitomyces sp. T112]